MGRAGALVALALAGCAGGGGDEPAAGPLVDERTGSYRGVTMGDSESEVRAALGEPAGGDGFAPAGESPADVGVPQFIPARGGMPTLLKYDDVSFLVGPGGVYAFIVAAEGAHTRRGVAIGDDLDAARKRYELRCIDVAGGESLGGGQEYYPSCRATVGGIRVWFGRDPIRSITLLSLRA